MGSNVEQPPPSTPETRTTLPTNITDTKLTPNESARKAIDAGVTALHNVPPLDLTLPREGILPPGEAAYPTPGQILAERNAALPSTAPLPPGELAYNLNPAPNPYGEPPQPEENPPPEGSERVASQ